MVYKIIFAQKQSPRGVIKKRWAVNMKRTHRTITIQSAISTMPLRTDASPVIRKNTLRWENTFEGLLLHVKRILKDLNLKKFLLTVVKRNLLTLKMNK